MRQPTSYPQFKEVARFASHILHQNGVLDCGLEEETHVKFVLGKDGWQFQVRIQLHEGHGVVEEAVSTASQFLDAVFGVFRIG